MKKNILAALFLWYSFPSASQGVVLENNQLKAEFNRQNGALIHLTNKLTGWEIVKRKSLGQSFELLLPLTENDIRFNVIKGVEQKAPLVEQKANEIIFTWKGMRNQSMKSEVDITFKGSVSLTQDGLEYKGTIINKSPYLVEYVSWPCLGEVTIPDKSQPLHHSTRQDTRELFPRFFNEHGYWGVDYPTSTYQLTEGAFVLVNNSNQGFLVYERSQPQHNLLITSFELIPGFELRNTNPVGEEMDGQLVRIQFKANQVIYNQKGETTLDPVVLSVYKGSLYAGMDKFRNNYKLTEVSSPAWFSEPLTWQKVHIGNANQLIEYAKESKPLGIDALQVRGWYHKNKEGIKEIPGLAEAINKCHEMNIHVVLETNWTSIEDDADYGNNLIVDPFGFPYTTSLVCPIEEAVRNKITLDWGKLQALHSADGFINNDNNHQNKTYLSFSKHAHNYGASVANGVLLLDKTMAEKMIGFGTDKIALGYGFIHQQNAWYNGYQINVPPSQFHKHRYLSSNPVLLPVVAGQARKNINEAVLFQFNPSYDFQLKDYPHILSYNKMVKSFIQRYKQQIWQGIFQPTDDVKVEGDNLSYSVLWDKEKKKKTIIVANVSGENEGRVKIKTNTPAAFMVATPEHPDGQPYHESFKIEPLSVAVFFEK